MSKKMNNEAAEKSPDHCKGIQAKRGSKSTQVDVRECAFEGVNDAAERLPATPTAQAGDSHEAVFQHPDSNEQTNLADPQRRDVKACISPSPEDVKDRLVAARRLGPDRPLWHLAAAEADLHARSAALAKLSSPQRKQPDKNLLVNQLIRTVDTSHVAKVMAPQLRGDAVALYSALQSKNAIESILDRHIVAMSISVMHCHARAAETSNPKTSDAYLRHVDRGSKTLIQLIEARDRRRNPRQIAVGNVNVEAGGQAIVGNVETPPRAYPSPVNDEEKGD